MNESWMSHGIMYWGLLIHHLGKFSFVIDSFCGMSLMKATGGTMLYIFNTVFYKIKSLFPNIFY